MKNDYEIQAPTPVCSQTGKPLQPGERFYSVLLEETGRFVRKDFSAEAWASGQPSGIAHWSGKIPTAERRRKPSFNDELLLNCFRQLADTLEPNRQKFRYVLSLLLMRRKRLKFEDLARADDGSQFLIVRDAQTGAKLEVFDPHLSEQEIDTVQDEVFQVLGWQ